MSKARDLNKEIDRRLTMAGIPHTEREIYRVNPSRFYRAIRKAKKSGINSWMVDLHTKKEYAGMKCYVTKDGQSGVCVTKDGDVVSLFSRSSEPNAMGKLIPFAIAHGGRKLDCYGDKLQNMYARYGAVAISQTPFNEEYAPDDWDGVRKPPIVAMILPSTISEIERRYDEGRRVNMRKVKMFPDKKSGYDEMIAYRDKQLKIRHSGTNPLSFSVT